MNALEFNMQPRLHYISPSLLPSRSANSIHVINQCNAIANSGLSVLLYAKRSVKKKDYLEDEVNNVYGIKSPKLKYVTYYNSRNFADNLLIAIIGIKGCVFRRADYILSRNLYAAFVLTKVFNRKILFETHQLEYGIKKIIQRFILSSNLVRTIVISNCLLDTLNCHHRLEIKNPLVLHDAAASGVMIVDDKKRRNYLAQELNDDIKRWVKVCGYFGHLYAGRGMDIILQMATSLPNCLFLVYGGSESDIASWRKKKSIKKS
jgi:hypothetical protein